MKRTNPLILLLVLGTLGVVDGLAGQVDFRMHFAGSAALGGKTSAKELTTIRDFPESANVSRVIRRQINGQLAKEFGLAGDAGKALGYALDRLTGGELFVEVRKADSGVGRVAVHVGKDIAKKIQSNLKTAIVGGGAKLEQDIDGKGSWSFQFKDSPKYHVSWQRDWLLIDGMSESQPSKWRQETVRSGRPIPATKSVLDLTASSEFLEQRIAGLKLPAEFVASFRMKLINGRFRTEGQLDFAEKQQLELEPFQMPTNTLRGPLGSFLAVRGISGLLAGVEALREWRIAKYPNQAVSWGQLEVPMYSLVAFPFPEAAKYLDRQKARFTESLNPVLKERNLGETQYMEDFKSVVWRGLPLWAPFVGAAPEPGGDWGIIGTVPGYIPRGPNTNPPPAELLKQITGRPKLIYYHWEITPPRLEQVRMMVELARMMSFKSFPAKGNPFPQWLQKIEPLLGNTITEVNRESDTRWSITRNSQMGLTATELALLSHWLTPKMEFPSAPPLPGK